MGTAAAAAAAVAAELRLRLRVEDLLALHREAPAADVVVALDALEAAALALVGAGVVERARGTAIVAEAVDALVARGAAWLAPAVPDLDVTRLYDATAGGGRPQLRRVVGVATTLVHGTITSVELWSDRAVARVVDAVGGVGPSHVVGAAGVDDRRLDLREGGGGGVVSVDLAGGRLVREVPGTIVEATVDRHLDALVALETAAATGFGATDLDALNGARARLAAAVDALDPDAAVAVLERFDAAVGSGPDAGGAASPLLLEVVPVAQRFFGGWLTSVEVWSDHWRAVVVGEEGAVRRRWTARAAATGAGGVGEVHTFGGVALDDDVVRFAGALPLDWSVLVLEGHGAGDVLELEVRR
jgi:hypothetical protein